ncbi:MAG: DNA polymerase III subunit gamma/tau [Acidobacteria bacterium]|nr:DNA polymerase III subunit gamma/tau [Acidobacteriota bacterium]
MSYLVIARKYRPIEFNDIVGQRSIVQSLTNTLREKKYGHAYLFSGTRGVGKTSMARILARALNCVEGPTPTPCNQCDSCRDILSGSSIDVFEIDGASNRRVEETQQIIENILYAPARDRYKIYIIDEVHMLSNHAFNALLKTLEEPPAHVIFMMATTEYHKIPQTILSRTQHFHFSNISQEDIANNLKKICEAEKIEISENAIYMVTREAQGSIRDAQSLLDQVIGFSGNKILDQDVETILGSISTEIIDRITLAIAANNSADVITLISEAYESGYDLLQLIRKLIERIRNLILLKVDFNKLSEQVKLFSENVESLGAMLEKFSIEQLLLIFDILSNAEYQMKYSQFPRFVLETNLIKTAITDNLVNINDLANLLESGSGSLSNPQIHRASGGYNQSGVSTMDSGHTPRITGLTPYSVMSKAESATYNGKTGKTDENIQVKQILNMILKESKALHIYILGVDRIKINDNKFTLYLSHQAAVQTRKMLIENTINRDIINKACKAILGAEAAYEVVEYIPEDLDLAAEKMEQEVQSPDQDKMQEIMKDPVVKKLAEKFGGKITEYKKEGQIYTEEE